ncbi:glutaminase [Flavilitoribacter nigricans]|uniref:Glutaminase n=1 Tax=Flavilitoribacter nigricans (strain ATCC 23147 / DSM 23189 / NBRC 102662 / NCIMB 1420 / SS-2) TaxID=1122177 RepID=A0A2D0NAG4_FLAN2|nr:glutaminase [Flavilitoribacter nigricans]PHN05378.1 glutaminase [Flavilitoribacter nigricans DSM 23189 = NBRC 102662]
MDCQKIIDRVYAEVKAGENLGQVAAYIPELSKIDPDRFGICLTSIDGRQYRAGDAEEPFSIQSIAKVLSLSLAFACIGEPIWKRVDVEPSGTAFNSLLQLESENGIPRNPLINAGAIVVCDILCGYFREPKKELINFIRRAANQPDIDYAADIAASEKSTGYRNFALINYLKSFGNIHNDIDQVIDLYFNLCSIKMNCVELSHTFLFLANNGVQLESGETLLDSSRTKRINAIMQTCGFYDEAGEFAYRVGLPGKSGVGGGITAILPNEYAIAVWSPRLNKKGNSYRGMKFLERFTTETESSIF